MTTALEDAKIPTRLKLAGLWCSVMFCYVYGDYFELYQPGKLQQMIAGGTGVGPVSQSALLGMSVMLVVPALMIVLSLVLPVQVSRWANVVLGLVYSAIMVLAIRGGWHFYVLMGLVEIALTLAITVYAWTWPKERAATAEADPLLDRNKSIEAQHP